VNFGSYGKVVYIELGAEYGIILKTAQGR